VAETPNMRVKISAEFADLKAALANIQQQLKGVGSAGAQGGREAAAGLGSVRGVADEIGSKLKDLVGILLTIKLGEFAHDALDTAEAIGKLSQKTGATTETLSAMRVAVHGSDEEFDLLGEALKKLASTQDKAASGNKEAVETFRRLGIAMEDVRRLNPGDLFLLISDRVSKMADGAEKAALAKRALGKAGADLIPIMRDLANGGFEEARKKAEALGVLLSEDMTAAADDANDAIDDLKLVGEGMANSFLTKLLPAVTSTLEGLRGSAEGDGIGAMEVLGQAAAGIIKTITGVFQIAGSLIAGVVASASAGADAVVDIRNRLLDFDVKGAAARYKAYVDQVAAIRAKFVEDFKKTGAEIFNAFAGNGPAPGKPNPNRAGGGGTEGEDPEGETKKAVKGIVDQAALAADAIKRELEVLKQNFDDGLLSIDAYFGRKLELQRQAIDLQIAQAEAEAKTATSSDQQTRALTKVVQLERERAELGADVEREKKKAIDDLNKSLDALNVRMLELNGQTAEAARLRLEGEFKGLLQRLQAEGKEAELATLRGFLDASVVKAQVSEFEARANEILSALRTAETSLGSQAAGGLLSPIEAERQIDAERSKSLEKLQQLRAAVQAYYAATQDPSVLQFLQQLTGEIGQVQAAQDQWRQQAQQLAVDGTANFLTKFATGGIRSLKDLRAAIAETVLAFIQGLARMAAEALAKRFIFSLLGIGGPSSSNFGIPRPGSGTLPGFVRHMGGLVDGSGPRRMIDPGLIGAPPRYHSGGLIGPRERLIVAQDGEEVLTENDPNHRKNRRAQKPGTYILAFGEQQLADALAGAAGERVFLLHAQNNPKL
jgi:hypothetical protein